MDTTRVTQSENTGEAYQTLCDSRLARAQALDVIEQFAAFMGGFHTTE